MKGSQSRKWMAVLVAELALVGGCAAPAGSGNANASATHYEPPDAVTGSNLPRRRGSAQTPVREADKDAIASDIRTQTRNTGQ